RAPRRARDESRRRRPAASNPRAAARVVESRHHPPRPRARPRLRADAQLLRPRSGRPTVRPLRQLRAPRPRLRAGRRRRSRGRSRRPRQSRGAEPAMTDRLYYLDPYLREFDATVVETTTHEGRTAVVLDRTAFYPTSG